MDRINMSATVTQPRRSPQSNLARVGCPGETDSAMPNNSVLVRLEDAKDSIWTKTDETKKENEPCTKTLSK
jgi:hypothetical protein